MTDLLDSDPNSSDEMTSELKPRMSTTAKLTVAAVAVSALVAVTCFTIVAVLPVPQGAGRFKDPLRSLLTGLGVLGVATPLCLAGHAMKKRSARSPYFEGTFIATVLEVFGFICLAVGLACMILGGYDWITSILDSRS